MRISMICDFKLSLHYSLEANIILFTHHIFFDNLSELELLSTVTIR